MVDDFQIDDDYLDDPFGDEPKVDLTTIAKPTTIAKKDTFKPVELGNASDGDDDLNFGDMEAAADDDYGEDQKQEE